MTRKRRRLMVVLVGLLALGAAAALVLSAFEDNIVFFFSPSELAGKTLVPGRSIRVGGLVEEGSITKLEDGLTTTFVITDMATTLAVRYIGVLPDLFREGQGVVAEGSLGPDGIFVALQVLARHDETYMPPEVAQALKDSGHWQEEEVP
jgi:cytochrome c-type biogenesis protein CcmE